jgi:hypothetical protein
LISAPLICTGRRRGEGYSNLSLLEQISLLVFPGKEHTSGTSGSVKYACHQTIAASAFAASEKNPKSFVRFRCLFLLTEKMAKSAIMEQMENTVRVKQE